MERGTGEEKALGQNEGRKVQEKAGKRVREENMKEEREWILEDITKVTLEKKKGRIGEERREWRQWELWKEEEGRRKIVSCKKNRG